MEEKNKFVFYRSFYECLEGLPEESQLKIFRSICNLALNNYENKDLKGIEKSIFSLIKPHIEANNKRYEASKKGGNPNFNKGQPNPYYKKINKGEKDGGEK